MADTALATSNAQPLALVKPLDAPAIETALLGGDLSKLSASQRMSFYHEVCKSVGLNPLTGPFGYISFQGKLTFYAKKDCAEQLRKLHDISTRIVSMKHDTAEGIFTVHIEATMPNGRKDEEIGVLHIGNVKGADLANARMKTVTKAKRRVTLSICGLGGMPDETEVEHMPQARILNEVELSVMDETAQDGLEERVQAILATIEAATDEDTLKVARKMIAEDPAKDLVGDRVRDAYNAKRASLKETK